MQARNDTHPNRPAVRFVVGLERGRTAMKAVTKMLASGVAAAGLGCAAPAAAQYYPGQGYGYGGGYGYNGYGYNGGMNQQAAVNQCAAAVQQRLGGGYGSYGGYGYNGYGGGRVLGISRVEPSANGGLTVRGVANSGRYGYGYNSQGQVDLTWRCKTDYRGFVVNVDVRPAQRNYGYGNYNYQPYNPYDYSQYGYQRY
jgi:hypothetical protein